MFEEKTYFTFPLRVHDKATLSFEDYRDRIELTLTNDETGSTSERTYYKQEENYLAANEALKIDTMLYFMSNEIGLNLWESK